MEFADIINTAYSFFENTQLSVTGLIVAALIFSLAFLFAIREAASWFFKVDTLKRDVRKLHELTSSLENEIKALQELLTANQPAGPAAKIEEGPTAIRSTKAAGEKGFSITH